MAQTTLTKSSVFFRRLLTKLLTPLLIVGLLFFQPNTSEAASGGRIGGGSFRAPSMPRTGGGGYRGGYGGGYRGGYGGGYRRGGGIGFPFLIPIFGFGGGGLFGFLVLMAITGAIINSLRGTNFQSFNRSSQIESSPQGPITMLQIQIGLLASAKGLQQDLRKLAESADTSKSSGLQKVLQETTLALLRQPELWVYSNIETGSVPFSSAEMTFNKLSLTERSKLSKELTYNVSGEKLNREFSESQSGDADKTNEFIVVTILVASKSNPISQKDTFNNENLQLNLRNLGSLSSTDLIALEIIWQPDGSGDVLSAEELLTTYPNLQHM